MHFVNRQPHQRLINYTIFEVSKQVQTYMRFKVYFASLFSYLTIHIMRMAIPFNQKALADYYGLSNQMVGLANSSIYIILGLAYSYRVVRPIEYLKTSYFYFVSLACLFYALIPIYVYMGVKSIPLLFLSMGAFGFFQSTSWPVVIKLVQKFFNAERDGFALGIWSANGDFGNVAGFFVCTAFVYYFHWDWELSLLFAACTAFIMSILVLKLPIPDKQQSQQPQAVNQTRKKGFVETFRELFGHMKNPSILYLVIVLCLLKALLYGVLLWLPLYLQNNGFKQFSGYIPISFSILTICGSLFFGFAYQMITTPIRRNLMFILINLISVAAFWGIKITPLETTNQWILIALVGITGFCIPGKYNIQVAHEVILMCKIHGIQILIWSSLMESLGYTFVGIFQIIIGISTQIDVNSIFVIFLITNILCLVIETLHFIYKYKKRGFEQQQQAILPEPNYNLKEVGSIQD